jgi:prolyl oligopeptidase
VQYPSTRMDSTVADGYHGTTIADPYRWLEDDNSVETKGWVKAQNEVAFGYLDKIPYRDAIEQRLKDFWNYERYEAPFKRGDRYYFFKNDGLQNQSILYALDSLGGQPKVALDPNQFSTDGTSSLGTYAFSNDGKLLAYEVSAGGSDWRAIRVQDMTTGYVLPDSLNWIKFNNTSWAGQGFFYCRYPEPTSGGSLVAKNEFHSVYYHALGTPQSKDLLVFADRMHPQRNMAVKTTNDERFLTLEVSESTSGNALYFRDLSKKGKDFVPVIERFDNDFVVLDNIGDNLLIHTNYKAPNWRLILVNTQKPNEANWQDIIPESQDVLQSIHLIGGKIVGVYIHNVSSEVKLFDLSGKEVGTLQLPGIGTVSNIAGKKTEPLAFFNFESFTQPSTVYQFDVNSQEVKVWKQTSLDFASQQYETKQVWYTSKDGTKIPMFIIHKKGLELDGARPTLLYGYGGFDISILPGFNVDRLSMFPIILENGGVCAVANIRGGGEFGAEWHKAGTLDRKQNVFDDFIAAAEYLTSQKYTSAERLAIYGRSNGGLLVGACMTQRPDLFKVALPAVGVLDMLRYHQFTIGWAWATDYGRSDNPKDFAYLIKYSPLHNLKAQAYPATLITTADHDDRVVPAHSFKFASALQASNNGLNPQLIRIETSAGHGAGKPTSKKIEEGTDILAFTLWNMKAPVIYDFKK